MAVAAAGAICAGWDRRCGHPEPETRKLQDKGFLLTSTEDTQTGPRTGFAALDDIWSGPCCRGRDDAHIDCRL